MRDEIFSIYTGFTILSSSLKNLVDLHERTLPEYSLFVTVTKLPNFLLSALAKMLSFVDPKLSKNVSACYKKDHFEVNDLHHRLTAFKLKLDQQWKAADIDVMFSPC